MLEQREQNFQGSGGIAAKSVAGRKLYIPRMSYGGAKLFAAACRSIGLNASPTPPSDERTIELGSRYTSGDECLPQKITLGDFLKITEQKGFEAGRTAFFMPTAGGPCRFGQYRPFLMMILEEIGLRDVLVFSPTSDDGYDGVGECASELIRTGWWAVVASDILRKLLLKTRPYEASRGDSDSLFEESLERLSAVLEVRGVERKVKFGKLIDALICVRNKFQRLKANYVTDKPLIGVVGEIFCRLNTFSNEYLIRKVENYGAECWLSDIGEWVWYTNWEQIKRIKEAGQTLSMKMLGAKLKHYFQRKDEHELYAPFKEDFRGYEEPDDVRRLLRNSEPYLPARGALGEMVLSAGKAIYLYNKGADGIIDISPFTCMNGIVCESIYPDLSKDHGGIPIKVFYYDGTSTNLERDIEIFLELARTYQRKKQKKRIYPSNFNS